jgi:hypothetical protein
MNRERIRAYRQRALASGPYRRGAGIDTGSTGVVLYRRGAGAGIGTDPIILRLASERRLGYKKDVIVYATLSRRSNAPRR